ncbi:MAG: pitrilysin family protein [Pseudomonadota bacterium]
MLVLALLTAAALADEDLTLDNGLRVVLREDHRAPLVVLTLGVDAGAADDPVGQAGAAHLLEHMLFEGSASLPGQGFDLALAEVGGDSNAWTHYDLMSFTQVLPPGALERALFLEADRLGRPSLDLDAVLRQRAVVRAEGAREHDTPHGRDAAALAALLYPGHPYARTLMGLWGIEGDPALTALDAAALRAFWEQRLPPERCVLVVAGDLDTAQATAWVRATLGAIPARPATARAKAPAPPLIGEQRHVLRANTGDRSLYLAWRGVPRGDPDEPALALLAWLLAGRGDAGLRHRLVSRGRARRVEAWSDAWRLGGGFVVSVSAWRGRLAPRLHAVDRELARMAEEGPTEEELTRARGAWRGTFLRAGDGLARSTPLLAQCALTSGEPDCLEDELARYEAVTAEDVRRVAQGLQTEAGRVLLSVVGPGARPLRGSSPLEVE